MKKLLVVACLVALAGGVFAQQAQLDGHAGFAFQFDQIASTREQFELAADSPLIDLVGNLTVNSDKAYGSDIANFRDSKSFFQNYILMEEGYTALHFAALDLQLGRAYQRETFDSPYSLFLNSAGHSANGMVIRYSDPVFLFESRWIELNNRSDFGSAAKTPESWVNAGDGSGTGFPDRGANLKTIVLKFGTMRFGIQDAAIYTGRSFDLEYFVNPIPEYFTQYFKTTSGRPWTTSGNENNLIGFFWDWKEPTFEAGAQVLVDDFSLHFLMPVQVPDNPWKAAWTFGGQMETEYGWVGLYHAGALKYTFAPITTRTGNEGVSAYGYNLYPSTEYYAETGFRSLSVQDNALGYQHGENNLALMATWSRNFDRGWKASSNVELVLAGANSPTNPWHDATHSNEVGTHWIDDPVLARTLVWSTDVRWTLGDWEFYLLTSLGYKGNLLKLSDPETDSGSSLDRYERIWRPSSSSEGIVSLSVGARWHWDISKTLWPGSTQGGQP